MLAYNFSLLAGCLNFKRRLFLTLLHQQQHQDDHCRQQSCCCDTQVHTQTAKIIFIQALNLVQGSFTGLQAVHPFLAILVPVSRSTFLAELAWLVECHAATIYHGHLTSMAGTKLDVIVVIVACLIVLQGRDLTPLWDAEACDSLLRCFIMDGGSTW